MNWTPTTTRVLVKPIDPPEGLIIIPDRYKETVRYAKVITVGPKVKEIKPGDVVSLPGVAASEPDYRINDLILVQEADIGFKVG